MPDARDMLNMMQLRADLATPGPWKSSIEGRDHLAGDDVIIDGRGEDIYIYQPAEDTSGFGLTERTATQDFIAHARTDMPRLVAALRAVLDLHYPARSALQGSTLNPLVAWESCPGCRQRVNYPTGSQCSTVRAITEALGGDHG